MFSVPSRFRRSTISKKNLLPLLFAFFLFLSIPVTVFVALNVRDDRSKAETIPYAMVEPGLKKIDLTYSPDSEKLTAKGKTNEARLPKKVERKEGKRDKKILSIKVEQLNEFDKPVYSFIYDLEVEVNSKGEFQKKDVSFSIDVPDKPGKVVFSLGERKLLEAPL